MVKDKLMAIAMKISILFFLITMLNVTCVHAADDEVCTVDNWKFKYITEDTVEIVGNMNCGRGKDIIQNLYIPDKLYHNNKYVYVVQIGENAFFDCGNFTSITIPEGVTRIGSGAFGNYYGLVTLPKTIE